MKIWCANIFMKWAASRENSYCAFYFALNHQTSRPPGRGLSNKASAQRTLAPPWWYQLIQYFQGAQIGRFAQSGANRLRYVNARQEFRKRGESAKVRFYQFTASSSSTLFWVRAASRKRSCTSRRKARAKDGVFGSSRIACTSKAQFW